MSIWYSCIANTLIELHLKLCSIDDCPLFVHTRYRQLVVGPVYLTISRPDIANVVCVVTSLSVPVVLLIMLLFCTFFAISEELSVLSCFSLLMHWSFMLMLLLIGLAILLINILSLASISSLVTPLSPRNATKQDIVVRSSVEVKYCGWMILLLRLYGFVVLYLIWVSHFKLLLHYSVIYCWLLRIQFSTRGPSILRVNVILSDIFILVLSSLHFIYGVANGFLTKTQYYRMFSISS